MKKDKTTYIFGQYYSSKDIEEIETNPIYKNTIVKSVLDLRHGCDEFREELSKSKPFKFIKKILDKFI